jgi:hypothetical protein
MPLLIVLIFNSGVSGQEEINYCNRSFLKSLSKAVNDEDAQLKEIIISDRTTERFSITGKYFNVSTKGEHSDIRYIYIGRVNSCRAGGCSISGEIPAESDYEYFDYSIFFDSICTVRQVSVFNYQATHGHEITAKGWLRQFGGYNGDKEMQVGKEIDGISGATISVYGITTDVQQKVEILKIICQNNDKSLK